MSANSPKNYNITDGTNTSEVQRIQNELERGPVLSVYIPLNADPTRTVGNQAEWFSTGRRFTSNPTDQSNDAVQNTILEQGIAQLSNLIRASNIDPPVEPLRMAPIPELPEPVPQTEEFIIERSVPRTLRNPTAIAFSKKRSSIIPANNDDNRVIKRAKATPPQIFQSRSTRGDLPKVPDSTIQFLRSLQND